MVFFKTPTADIKKPEGYFILCLFVYLVFTLSVLTCYVSVLRFTLFLVLNREQLLLLIFTNARRGAATVYPAGPQRWRGEKKTQGMCVDVDS